MNQFASSGPIWTGTTVGAAPAPDRKMSELESHAAQLAEAASALASANQRLVATVERLRGSAQGAPAVGINSSIEPTPSGLVYVAQFERRRISNSVSDLNSLIDELNVLV